MGSTKTTTAPVKNLDGFPSYAAASAKLAELTGERQKVNNSILDREESLGSLRLNSRDGLSPEAERHLKRQAGAAALMGVEVDTTAIGQAEAENRELLADHERRHTLDMAIKMAEDALEKERQRAAAIILDAEQPERDACWLRLIEAQAALIVHAAEVRAMKRDMFRRGLVNSQAHAEISTCEWMEGPTHSGHYSPNFGMLLAGGLRDLLARFAASLPKLAKQIAAIEADAMAQIEALQ